MKMKLVVILLLIFLDNVIGYCWQPGKNPYFTAAPKVEQVTTGRVRVSWEGSVANRECADQFLVKYWQRNMPLKYKMSELVRPDFNYIEIEVTPRVTYEFQAVAREDKGAVRGIDWNKSDQVSFTTSVYNEVAAEPPAPHEGLSPEILEREIPYTTTENPAIKERSQSGIVFMGMTFEILAIAVIGILVVVLVIIGLIFKCFQKTKPGDEKEFEDEKSQNESEDEEDPCLA